MTHRRTFIKNVSFMAGCISAWPHFVPSFSRPTNASIDLEIYATNWGFKGDMEAFCKAAQVTGYDGIEVWAPRDISAQEKLKTLIAKYNLKLGVLSGNSGSNFEEHLEDFKKGIDAAVSLQPEFINCHSGKDYFSPEQGDAFIEVGRVSAKASGIPIYHEGHRGRLLYAAHVTEQYIDRHEDLSITLDISHWTNVHESLLEDQSETIQKSLERTDHVHSRVGFQEGPQIPNPNDPQYESIVKAHFAWWDEVVRLKSIKGEKLTMTTEFGPPGYMWTKPFDGSPVADNWEVNRAMMHVWQDRYLK